MTDDFGLLDGDVPMISHAKEIEPSALAQIQLATRHPAFMGLIAIMPDVHAGKGAVIGFTGKFRNAIISNIVGVDIGCGCAAYPLGQRPNIDFAAFDAHARKEIPLGFHKHDFKNYASAAGWFYDRVENDKFEYAVTPLQFYEAYKLKESSHPLWQVGTLGGGNHFIEIDRDPTSGECWLVVHTGSRNFGLQVATYFQKRAEVLCKEMGIIVPTGMEYLPKSAGGDEYMKWMTVAQEYAKVNRLAILSSLFRFFGKDFDPKLIVESVHNYISPRDGVIRKGAISAFAGEKVIIPLNMADGTIFGIGKGNPKWNNSAPHGAGRAHGRKEMFRLLDSGQLTIEQFNDRMKGIYSTSVKRGTFDESPMAYKSADDILSRITETVDITQHLMPIYNLKDDSETE